MSDADEGEGPLQGLWWQLFVHRGFGGQQPVGCNCLVAALAIAAVLAWPRLFPPDPVEPAPAAPVDSAGS